MSTILGLVLMPYYGASALNKISSSSQDELEEIIDDDIGDF